MKVFKGLLPGPISVFVFCFMLFIFEPIVLYSGNVNDFWFDLGVMMSPSFLAFILMFLGGCLALLALFFVAKKVKKKSIFYIFGLVFFDLFLIFYVHGNFLSGGLPSLNGETINWAEFKFENVISIIISLVILSTTGILIKKLGAEKVFKTSGYVSGAIFLMILVSTLTTLFTTKALEPKPVLAYATEDHINEYSSEKNFLILLVDAVDSKTFSDTVKDDPLYMETFKDFSYFPDTVGAYRLTRDSIPFIFSGKWNRNETDFTTYSTEAFDSSSLFRRLEEENYELTFYDEDFVWQSKNALKLKNVVEHKKTVKTTKFLKQEIKYLLFKYLPFPLKRFSRIESLNFIDTQIEEEKESFDWGDVANYKNIKNNKIELGEKKHFQFLHLEGAHVPFDLDENLNQLEEGAGTYEQKCMATLKIINAYLERIKEAGIYDDSAIIVMADHGYRWPVNADPILYIKGFNERHSELLVSDKAVWYPDLAGGAYDELLDGKKSDELFFEIETSGRDRYIIHNPFKEENHMIEYVQTGKAWDRETLKETGRTFDR